MAWKKSSRALWSAYLEGGGSSPKPSAAKLPVEGGRSAFVGTVLGVDPSLRGTGLARVRIGADGSRSLLFSRTLKLGASLNFYDCIGEIAQEMEALIAEDRPDWVAVEETIYVQNFRTAQILGAARGAALAAAARRKVPIAEYAPLRIKQAVVGTGKASKEQVSGMVKGLLGLPACLPWDESDAAAVALCHAFTCAGQSAKL